MARSAFNMISIKGGNFPNLARTAAEVSIVKSKVSFASETFFLIANVAMRESLRA